MRMDATTFATAFRDRMRDVYADSDDKPEWTEAVTRALREIGEQGGYHVRARTFDKASSQADEDVEDSPQTIEEEEYALKKGEARTIDVSYYSKLTEHCHQRPEKKMLIPWHPVVFIEHENVRAFSAARRDFHKVCLFAVPLRVFIGYGKKSQQARETGKQLTVFYRTVGLRQIGNGETLIIMSRRPRLPDDKWFMWLRRGDQEWEPFSA